MYVSHGLNNRTKYPNKSRADRIKNPIENKGLKCLNKCMAKHFDPYYNLCPIERELVHYVIEMVEGRDWDHQKFGQAIWGKSSGGRIWRKLRNKEPSEEDGQFKKPRRLSFDDLLKIANYLNKKPEDLISEARDRYEYKTQKNDPTSQTYQNIA